MIVGRLPDIVVILMQLIATNGRMSVINVLIRKVIPKVGYWIIPEIIIIEKITPAWITELLSYYKILYELLDNHNSKTHELSQETVNLITAALFYFINPFDLLYDVIPDPGYIDDLYILTLCINALRKEDDKIIKEKLENLF